MKIKLSGSFSSLNFSEKWRFLQKPFFKKALYL